MSSIDEFAIPNTILRHFDLSSTPWNELSSPQIENKRRNLPDGKLFFDRLLELVGLDGPSLYPPNTPAALRRLLHSIQSLELDRLKKDCFLYYLLKDYDGISSESQPTMEIDDDDQEKMNQSKSPNGHVSTKSDGFAKKRCMPLTWKRFMDGYWALDHGSYETAISSLSDPSITILNFVPSIIQTLSTHVSPPSHSLSLIHHFLVSAHPELTTQEESDVRLIALASSGNLSQAFSLIRSNESMEERKRNRENVYCWILGSPRISCGSGSNTYGHDIQVKSLKELLHIPSSTEEDEHLIDFLIHPPIDIRNNISSTALSLLHDLVTLRLIHQGQYSESLLLDKQLVGSGGNVGKEKDRQRRREMVREFISILPEAQRRALLADVESKQINGSNGLNGEDTEMSSSISDSWIKVNTNGPSYAEIASEPPSIPIPAAINSHPSPAIISDPSPVPTPVSAPTPIKPSTTHTSLFNAAQNSSLQPSPQKPSSPFSGPPRFAPGSSTTVPSPRRVLSGSPFNLPASSSNSKARGSPAPTLKLPKQIINDDEEEEGSVLARRNTGRGRGAGKGNGRSGRGVSMSVEPDADSEENQDQEIETMEIDHHTHSIEPISEEPSSSSNSKDVEPPKSIRKSRRVVSSSQKEKPKETTPPPPSSSRNTRQSTAPTTPGINGMPGSFLPSDKDSEEMPPPPPPPATGGRSTRASSNASTTGSKARSRMTRSASRAILDEDDNNDGDENLATPGPPNKKTKSTITRRNRSSLAPSEFTDDGINTSTNTNSVRRSTRSRTAQPSEQGSPTPSLARSEISTSSRRGTSRAGSSTPRMTTRTRRG
ncbi:uncharacterized protein IL334_004189 [Kwoniella shivajii]|uniref:ELYS-like domain-containing protein n=1 Tax=Kwoniella shivajii TaxID=564305 RepID=A0ABZ1CZN0_9TREE|nr:hypothetical protein IL334_004189 [Kwoniella shivajii]